MQTSNTVFGGCLNADWHMQMREWTQTLPPEERQGAVQEGQMLKAQGLQETKGRGDSPTIFFKGMIC